MNRRDFLANLRNFCLIYGIQNVLSEEVYAQAASPQRLVNFVIKYCGGGTDKTGVGAWHTGTGGVLSPLSAYAGQLAVPLGLDAKFHAPMNSHASPQVCALSGSMTGFVMRETEYPTGNLRNWTTGGGKSMDVLVGERLQSVYSTKLPYLLIGNNEISTESSTHKTSSWGAGGAILQAHYSVNGLAAELASRVNCQEFPKQVYVNRLEALKYIKSQSNIFSSRHLIDAERFDSAMKHVQSVTDRYRSDITTIDSQGPILCSNLASQPALLNSYTNRATFNTKMDLMYDLAVSALRANVTRVLTFNLIIADGHAQSHFSEHSIDNYLEVCRFYQASIASFMQKLSAANLTNGTVVFCNAGSCSYSNVHNYENLSAYVIGAGVSGVRGSVADRKPVGSLLVEVMNKFGLGYTQYGGSDHTLGVGQPSGLLG